MVGIISLEQILTYYNCSNNYIVFPQKTILTKIISSIKEKKFDLPYYIYNI